MNKLFFTLIIPFVLFVFLMTSCTGDADQGHDNSGNSAGYPPQPADSEYPGSKQYDSVHNYPDTTKPNQHNK
jgi:hypothetical protein